MDGQQLIPIWVINGPNLNLLGEREPQVYGSQSLADINAELIALGSEWGLDVQCHQSNHEGRLIDLLHDARIQTRGVVLNAGAYTHTSIALHDAIAAIHIPVIEVHLSNVFAREAFRHHSMISAVCEGVISGFGVLSYQMALFALKEKLCHPGDVDGHI